MADYTILVVDYEPLTAEQVEQHFAGKGLKIEIAKDGVAGIAAFRKLKPVLTLIEFMLPLKAGLDLCQELRQLPEGKRANLVVMGSRFRGRHYRYDAIRTYGATEYIEKPLDVEKLKGLADRYITPLEARPEQPAPAPVATTSPTRRPAATPVEVGAGAARPAPTPVSAATPSAQPADRSIETEIEDQIDSLLDF